MLTDQQRGDYLEFVRRCRANPAWDAQLFEHRAETMRCILRRYEFSWLPMETLLQWARALPDA